MKNLLILAICVLASFTFICAQPVNDDCSDAISLSFIGGPIVVSGTSLGAGADILSGIGDDCKPRGPFNAIENPAGAWYKIPLNTTEIHFSLDASNHIISLVKSSNCTTLDFIECNHTASCSGHDHVHNGSFTIAASSLQHYLLIYPAFRPLGSPPFGGPFTVELDDSAFPSPSNNTCQTAMPLVIGDTVDVKYKGQVHGDIDQELFYSFTAQYPEMILKHLGGGSASIVQYDTACNSISGPFERIDNGMDYEWSNLVVGQEYDFRLSPFRYCEDYPLAVVLEGPPLHQNDSCQNAQPLSIPTTTAQFVSVQQSYTYNAPHPISCEGTNGVWYTIEAPAGGENLIFTGSYDGLSFYDNCSSAQVLCISNGANEEFVSLPIPGQTYLMYYEESSDPFGVSFSYRVAPPAPVNDDCVNAISLGILTHTFTSFSHAFGGGEKEDHLPTGNQYGVWYEFTTGAVGNVQVVVEPCTDFAIFDECDGVFMGTLGYVPPPFCPFPPCPEPDSVLINFEPHTTYKLLLYTQCGASGATRGMSLRTGEASSGNDLCSEAEIIDLTGVDTVTSLVDTALVRTAAGFGDLYLTRGLWYKVLIPSDFELNIDYCGTFSTSAKVFYQSNCQPGENHASHAFFGSCHVICNDPGPAVLPYDVDTLMVYVHATYFEMFGGGALNHGNIGFYKTPSRFPYARRVDINSPCTTGCDGTSWDNAYRDMHEMLAQNFDSGQIIWTAEGVYYPDDSLGSSSNDRQDRFVIKDELIIEGGYHPTGTYTQERDPLTYPTIFSGEIQQDGDHTNNTETVVELRSFASLDGITIEEGNAGVLGEPGGPGRDGGGLHSAFGGKFSNMIFRNNSAVIGGGLYAISNAVEVDNCIFYDNHSYAYGGALGLDFIPGSDVTRIDNITMEGNTSDTTAFGKDGAAIAIFSANIEVNNSIIHNHLYPYRIFSGAIDMNYSLSEGGFSGVGIIDADPIFADVSTNDYNLLLSSPCVDTGNDTLVSSEFDIAGNTRIEGFRVDMGAYEFTFDFPCGRYTTLNIDDIPVFSGVYRASGLISSAGEVNSNSNGNVIYISENAINLNPEFEVTSGQVFEAKIQNPCVD